MRRQSGILHGELLRVIAEMRHGDELVIADAGLPVPPGVAYIDIAIVPNLPRFLDVLKVVLTELVVEKAVIASETFENTILATAIQSQLSMTPQIITHKTFKQRTMSARAIIRTGEFTPFANIILVGGVNFSTRFEEEGYDERHPDSSGHGT